jgi:multicomponent Na+:H+ antiporter subunit D
MTSFPPALIFIIGAILLIFTPRRIRSAAFLVFPALTFWWLLTLSPGDTLTIQFLSYNLMPLRVDELSLAFGYVFVIIAFFGGIYAYHMKDLGQRLPHFCMR